MSRRFALRALVTMMGISIVGVVPAAGRLAPTGMQPADLRGPVWQQGPSEPQAPMATFRTGVDLVTLSASVRDRRGRVVRDLTKADFQVFESGVRRFVLDVFAGESPISLGVVLDISGSMAVGGNMDRARRAVDLAMGGLQQEGDEAALFTFDSLLREVVGFTTELDLVRRVSLEGRPWGITSLFDAIAEAARVTADRTNRRRAVLVITDGVDTGSAMTPGEVSAIASAIDVPVYLLVVLHPLDYPRHRHRTLAVDGRAAEIATLADLARWTGGTTEVSSTAAQIESAVRELFTELRYQYLITFEPGLAGGWQSLEVRTPRRDVTIQARSAYMAGSQ